MRALLSILTLYKYDNTLFDGLILPDGVDKSALINELCMQLGELNTIISNPDVMKLAITEWSKTRQDVWQHMYDTTQYEYNPIWNKDGTYTETETRDLHSTMESAALNQVTGYNAEDMRDANRTEADGSGTDSGTITRRRVEQGNIGVTTTQQMIKEEREIAEFNLFSMIINEFKTRFCIMVY